MTPGFPARVQPWGWIIEPATTLVKSGISRMLAVHQAAARLPVPLRDSWELLLVL